uniref:uncharacterized protein LOC130472585 n=1 Tax=Euleptes europaea TaxID=460621 RepID=UPI00253F8B82|nr:uncharacterized protein LOC130472585 [Euleptes europaea]
MAAGGPLKELCEEASCSVCLDFFRDPVTIAQCGHNFCRACLSRSWGESGAEASCCPQCRGRAQEGTLRPNQQLANFVQIAKKLSPLEGKEEKRRGQKRRRGVCEEPQEPLKFTCKEDEAPLCVVCSRSEEHQDHQVVPLEERIKQMWSFCFWDQTVVAARKERVCQKHQEPLKLFCKEDEALICVVCDQSQEHKHHKIIPVKEASQEYKDEFCNCLEILRKEREKILASKVNIVKESQDLLKQTKGEQQKTMTKFRQLHTFPDKQEKLLLSQVEEVEREVARKRDQNLAELSEELSSLDSLIWEMEEKSQQPASELLQDARSTLQRYEEKEAFENPVAFPLVLKWRIWDFWDLNSLLEGIKKQLKDTLDSGLPLQKANVTLDPDTAFCQIFLSKHLKSMRWEEIEHYLSNYPETFDEYGAVLGCEGFTAGRHFWEVLVGSEEGWSVGVARESVRMLKGDIIFSPEEGIWEEGKRGGCFQPQIKDDALPLTGELKRIQVCLNYAGGRVAFFDAERGSLIHEFSGASFRGETLLPFFWLNFATTSVRLSNLVRIEFNWLKIVLTVLAVKQENSAAISDPSFPIPAMSAGGLVHELCEEASCSICLDFFRDPVTIAQCGHNFCRACLTQSWGVSRAEASCPQCRGRAQEGTLRPNKHLANFVEIAKNFTLLEGKEAGGKGGEGKGGICEKHQEPLKFFCKKDEAPLCVVCGISKEHQDHQVVPLEEEIKRILFPCFGNQALVAARRGRVCQKHQEPLKLFCTDDEALICVVCDRSKEHRDHKTLPIEEASQEYKDQFCNRLERLKKERERIVACQANIVKESQYLLKQTTGEKQEMTAKFRQLHSFLEEKEKLFLAQMEEVEKEVARKRDQHLARLSEELCCLEILNREMEEKCQQPASELLQDARSTLQRYEEKEPFENPVAFPLVLKWRIWDFLDLSPLLEGIKKQLKDTLDSGLHLQKANVTLDPDTAHPKLVLSEDRKSVRLGEKVQALPRNPERFDEHGAVLGRQGFRAGRHYWEVLVGSEESWTVGVARKSVRRKGWVTFCPEEGIWAVGKWLGQYWAALKGQYLPLSLSGELKRIRVCLNYAGGRVTFFDADRAALLCEFSGASFRGETLLPSFAMSKKGHLRLSC